MSIHIYSLFSNSLPARKYSSLFTKRLLKIIVNTDTPIFGIVSNFQISCFVSFHNSLKLRKNCLYICSDLKLYKVKNWASKILHMKYIRSQNCRTSNYKPYMRSLQEFVTVTYTHIEILYETFL